METFEVVVPKTYRIKRGFGVAVFPVYEDSDDDNSRIADADISVVAIEPESVVKMHGSALVPLDDGLFVSANDFKELSDLWEDDTIDLRWRLFETREEAEDHAAYITRQLHDPLPWESFVRFE